MRRAAVVLALAAFVAGLVWVGRFTIRWTTGPTCQATAAGQTHAFTPEQTSNASLITAVAMKRGLPARAATIALATAIQESGLRNIDYGDRDSVGLFQQRPSQGWGTVEQIMDPLYSAGAFYDALVKVDDYENRPITEVAQEVQRSAYPTAYADHEQEGRTLASTLSGHSPAGLACRLDAPAGTADADAVAAALREHLGYTARIEGDLLTVATSGEQDAWTVAGWATAQAQSLDVSAVALADREWRREEDPLTWHTVPAAEATTVRISLS